MSTPLTTAIQNLTASANQTTGASDTTLSAAVSTLIAGYGGGGGSTLITKSITANGTYNASDDSADGYSQITVNVPTGLSNVVTGTFTGTTAGEVLSVTLNYSGSGYPVGIIVAPSEGTYNSSGTFYQTIQNSACAFYSAYKNYPAVTPTYADNSNTANLFMVGTVYKSSDSSSSTTTAGRTNAVSVLSASNPYGSSSTYIARLHSATDMDVFIADSAYGFMANIPYTYYVIYSS